MSSPFASPRALFGSLSIAALAAVGVTALVSGTSSAGPKGGAQVRMLDECDPVSFALADVPCVGGGHVTIGEVGASVAVTGAHPAWKFKDTQVSMKAGTSLLVQNRGGEGHSFTEVKAFGTGVLPQLNSPIQGAAPAAPVDLTIDFANPATWGVKAPGSSTTIVGLGVGQHKFQCLIHPWMRTTVTVS
jgi:plastocyanin